jgi:two-component system NtrC family sensor kinase
LIITRDLKENEAKISHHGKRAEAIIKGMLQHSRNSTAQKEPTDINVLCDEYLRLAYHGFRARDKSFNAAMKTNFDPHAGIIQVIPQEIGRALLNLFNNAFYVMKEKRITAGPEYEPVLTLTTLKVSGTTNESSSLRETSGSILISIHDNGPGIPQKWIGKIFQPFFTTKPTGQGTGLGLSLSYDIVKAHGGTLTVETVEGKGTTFIVQLPTTA